jgi:hypothetical protein
MEDKYIQKIITWLATNDANTKNLWILFEKIDARNSEEHNKIVEVLEKKVSFIVFSWSMWIIASLMAFFFTAHVSISTSLASLSAIEESRHNQD